MKFILTWLMAAQLLLLVRAQYYGRFKHSSSNFSLTYDVSDGNTVPMVFTRAGLYEGVDPLAPYLKILVDVFRNGELDIRVACHDNATPFSVFPLVRNNDLYLHYALQPTQLSSPGQLLSQVREVCPDKDVEDGDFATVTFATPRLIYLTLGGKPIVLRRNGFIGIPRSFTQE
ncbi:hypothetical protein FOZ63_012895 [Perkinsus olseni]|uniref:Uncharacterized protein n=1 Tax=Perkinsus olseni TaxID=32597 RepID=A0A7J6QS65_PEROL|nr:hypothetical protein FOZ63_012895 [Perkinsus olseni]